MGEEELVQERERRIRSKRRSCHHNNTEEEEESLPHSNVTLTSLNSQPLSSVHPNFSPSDKNTERNVNLGTMVVSLALYFLLP